MWVSGELEVMLGRRSLVPPGTSPAILGQSTLSVYLQRNITFLCRKQLV